ncbi:MAG: hypothetical protein IPK60_04140 [Sandaracinaceae bacterium]|nr:hypothetical protein [Sandaracinaceae bacterium]
MPNVATTLSVRALPPIPTTSILAASLHASAAAFLELYGYAKATQWSDEVMRTGERHDLLETIAARLTECADVVAQRAVELGVNEGRGRIDRALGTSAMWTVESVRTTSDLVARFRALRDVLDTFSHQAALAGDSATRRVYHDVLNVTMKCYFAIEDSFDVARAA